MDEQIVYKDGQKYRVETRIVSFGERTIRINNYHPILPPKEYERRKREIEQRLYDVFSKYKYLENQTSE